MMFGFDHLLAALILILFFTLKNQLSNLALVNHNSSSDESERLE